MADRIQSDRDDRGLSARQMVMILLAVVAVCAVFFAAGFLIGYNERTSKGAPSAERVEPSAVIPPTVNPPLKAAESSSEEQGGVPVPPAPAAVRKETERREAKPTAQPQPANAPKSAPSAQGSFAVQVAASGSREDAEKIAQTLKSRGFPAFLVPPGKADAKDKLYRVQVGPYPTREAAEAVKPKLEQEGFKQPFIKH